VHVEISSLEVSIYDPTYKLCSFIPVRNREQGAWSMGFVSEKIVPTKPWNDLYKHIVAPR
jgi:hypothetical protein